MTIRLIRLYFLRKSQQIWIFNLEIPPKKQKQQILFVWCYRSDFCLHFTKVWLSFFLQEGFDDTKMCVQIEFAGPTCSLEVSVLIEKHFNTDDSWEMLAVVEVNAFNLWRALTAGNRKLCSVKGSDSLSLGAVSLTKVKCLWISLAAQLQTFS